MRIFLVGYMGSGKSKLGKRLARKLHLEFLDTDKQIEETTQMSIPELFAKKGEAFFRQKELECLKMCFGQDNILIATGGGTCCQTNLMQEINRHGFSIYLQLPAGVLHYRLINAKQQRPLLQQIPIEKQREFIEHHLQQREQYYCQANLTLNTLHKTMEEIVEIIATEAQKYNPGTNVDPNH